MAKEFNLNKSFEHGGWKIFEVDNGETYYIAAKSLLDAMTVFLTDCDGMHDDDGLCAEPITWAKAIKTEVREETDDPIRPWLIRTLDKCLVEDLKEIDPDLKAIYLSSTAW